MKPNKDQIQEIIDSIQETENFRQAFTHTSYCHENKSAISYERLEFLGDRILNFYVALFIYRNFPDFAEGKMSKLQQLMVKESTLAHLSKEIGLNRTEYLRLGEGEIKNQGTNKSSILADIFESFIAALYLEKGEEVEGFLKLTLFAWIEGKEDMIWDYKSWLQEHCQHNKNEVFYREIKEKFPKKGSKAQHQFLVKAYDRLGTFCEIGMGKSKQEAEQEAAAKVIRKLGLNKSE